VQEARKTAKSYGAFLQAFSFILESGTERANEASATNCPLQDRNLVFPYGSLFTFTLYVTVL